MISLSLPPAHPTTEGSAWLARAFVYYSFYFPSSSASLALERRPALSVSLDQHILLLLSHGLGKQEGNLDLHLVWVVAGCCPMTSGLPKFCRSQTERQFYVLFTDIEVPTLFSHNSTRSKSKNWETRICTHGEHKNYLLNQTKSPCLHESKSHWMQLGLLLSRHT